MSNYVLDTGVFRRLFDSYPKKGIFEMHWMQLDEGFNNGELLSVDECYEELIKFYDEKDMDISWLTDKKKYFYGPTNEESIFIKNLFKNKKYQELIHDKNIIQNLPSADPFLIAKAKSMGATLVTTEVYKTNSSRIPTICEAYDIRCLSYEDFMAEYIKN